MITSFDVFWISNKPKNMKAKITGGYRESNPGSLAPEASILPLDHIPCDNSTIITWDTIL